MKLTGFRQTCLVSLTLLPGFVGAQELLAAVDMAAEETFFDDVPVVLSATRLRQSLHDVPASMTVIDRQTIELSGAQTLPDLLRLVPGMTVGQVSGNQVAVTYHGLSDQYARDMQVLIDGRSIYDAGYGGTAWYDHSLLPDEIERIEVIRGPNSAAYGANAFAATINIVTRDPADLPRGQAQIAAGNNTARRVTARHAGNAGGLRYRLTAGYQQDDGLDSRYDNSDTRLLDFRADYDLNSSDSLLIKLGWAQGNRQDGFGSVPTDPGFDVYQPQRTLDNGTAYQQLKWSRVLGPDESISLQGYHNYQRIGDAFQTVTFSDYFSAVLNTPVSPAAVALFFGWPDQQLKIDRGLKSDRYDLELQHNLAPTGSTRLVWGLGARYDRAESSALFGNDKSVGRYLLRGFGNAEWRPSRRVLLNAGLMIESYEGFAPELSPRLGINFQLHRNHTLRVSASRAIRIPTLVETNLDLAARFQDDSVFDTLYQGQANNDPEKIRSYELGYIGRFPMIDATVDIKLFRDEIRDFIASPNTSNCVENRPEVCVDKVIGNPAVQAAVNSILQGLRGAFVYANAGSVNIQGVEMGLTSRPDDKTLLRLSASRMKTRGSYLSDSSTNRVSDFEPQVPRYVGSLLLGREVAPKTWFSIGHYVVGSMEWRGEGDPISASHRTDLRIARDFKLSGRVPARLSFTWQQIGQDDLDFRAENSVGPQGWLQFEAALP